MVSLRMGLLISPELVDGIPENGITDISRVVSEAGLMVSLRVGLLISPSCLRGWVDGIPESGITDISELSPRVG